MKDTVCVGNCMFASIRQLFSEHFYIILAAGIVGALFGLVSGGGAGVLAGAGIGIVLAVAYGFIPRMADCAGACPVPR